MKSKYMYNQVIKRGLDLVLSFLAIIILIPLFFVISFAIIIDSKGPIFFLQKRLGKHEKIFKIYKFRSMISKKRDIHEPIFEGDKEITYIGNILRRYKLDELPQLLNVLKGEMSIVGPRPCLSEMKNKFGKYSNYRFQVKPGLTSLAAVNGSIYLTFEEKGYYDYIYTKKISFIFDLKIIIKTIKVLFVGEKKLFAEK